MLKTEIPKVDAFIAKETLMQVVYTTMKYGNCKYKYCFYNITSEDFKIVENKIKKLFKD